ncbi:hypothetical protein [Pseudarthrobacter raffinosi]|uniref:hypothetical protein n=1 Tax=Pseudarthrobacter raffinosi TaxID=2953651 RepID=UPI00208F8427|nr:hypothetical protein [Pseudarthrobacter sp. MDT3-28]MCO4238719.1 hypothetical protein [Pseudarthrobacter sp. MDT3-28]
MAWRAASRYDSVVFPASSFGAEAHQGATITPAEILASGGEDGDTRVWLKKAGPDERISELVALCEGDEFFTT